MEKIKQNSLTSCKISKSHSPKNKLQKQTQINLRPLGGICLYNEHYKRHIQSREDRQQPNLLKQKQQMNNSSGIQSKQFDQLYFEQRRIKQVLNDQSAEIHKHHNIAYQIEKIIGELRHSQLNTVNLMEEIKRSSNQDEFQRFCSFQEIFQLYTKKNISKFSTIMQKIEQQLRKKFRELLKRVKYEQLEKLKKEDIKMVADQSVQTHVDYHTQNLQDIQKELEKELDLKKIQYDALFNHNTQTLIDFNQSTFQFEQTINKQKVFIKNLELRIKQKGIQMKKLQNQLKNVQDSLLRKLVQRKSYVSELQSIEEDQPQDAIQQNRISITLKKKFRKKIQKRRAESVIVVKNEARNKLRELISQISDLQSFKSKSMRDIHQNTFQKEKEKPAGVRISIFEMRQLKKQPSKNKKNEPKQIERYKNKSDFGKKISYGSNQSMKLKKFDFYQRKLARKSQSKLYVQMQRLSQKKQTQNNYKNRFTVKKSTRPSFESSFAFKANNNTIKDFHLQRNSLETKDQNINTDLVAFNSGKISEKQVKKTQISIYQGKPSQKSAKILKEVSFHLKNDHAFDLKLCSNEISICIGNNLNSHKIITRSEQNLNYKISPNYSPKKKKNNLKVTKSKLTKKTHFKATSQLPLFNKQFIQKEESFIQQKQDQIHFSPASKQNTFSPCQEDNNYLNPISQCKQKQSLELSKKNNYYDSKYFENKVKEITLKCNHKDQFMSEFSKIHQGCAENCQHLKKYLYLFQKLKRKSFRSAFRLKVQDINSHIKQNQIKPKLIT